MNLKETIADRLDMPKDAVLDVSKLIITGNREIYIENYKGIAEYTTETVRLGTGTGIIQLKGESLVIKSIGTDEITLAGKIKSVEFV